MASLFNRFESNTLFREYEAWSMFRLAAIGEAVGWSLLISGILCKRYLVHGNNDPVLIAGQIHGMLFLLYSLASLGLYPSLHWSRKRAIAALLASIPPYGSLIFELWAHFKRSQSELATYGQCVRWTLLLEELSL